jgi:hypothetical protein
MAGVLVALSAAFASGDVVVRQDPGMRPGLRTVGNTVKNAEKKVRLSDSHLPKSSPLFLVPGDAGEVLSMRDLVRRRTAEGGGADIVPASLVVIETNFIDSNCVQMDAMGNPINVVLLIWDESAVNPSGVDIIIDGMMLVNVPGLTQDEINAGASNFQFIGGVPAGPHTFRVEESDTGTSAEQSLTVLDVQPFGDVGDVQCSQALVDDDGDPATPDVCAILNCYSNCGPLPDYNTVLIGRNGTTVGAFDFCNRPGGNCDIFVDNPNTPEAYDFFLRVIVTITGVDAADWDFTFIGFSEETPGNPNALYRGCFVSSDVCTLDCVMPDCPAPFCPWIGQTGYNPADGMNPASGDLLWLWEDGLPGGADYPGGTNLLADGAVFGTVPPGTDIIGVNAPLGPVVLGVQGECGVNPGDIPSAVTGKATDVLAAPLLANPVDGVITSTFDSGAGSTTAEWTNAERSSVIFVFQVSDPMMDPIGALVDLIPGALPGEMSSYTLAGTAETDLLGFQFFEYQGGTAYGSANVLSQPPMAQDFFIRGLCSGVVTTGSRGQPQISDAVFLFGFLFTGTIAVLPCQIACDADGNGTLELTDGIRVLRFLFLGGPPPVGWVGTTPTCEPFVPEAPGANLGCATPLAQCMGPGPL